MLVEKKDVLVSIIIPIYNCENYIKKCLDSLINQTYKNIEIICINDGSLDNTYEVLKKIGKTDKRIKIINKINEGVSVARNTGLKVASGEYIMFVDADDWIEETSVFDLVSLKDTSDLILFNFNKVENNIVYRNTYNFVDKDVTTFNKKQIKEEILPKFLSGEVNCFVCCLFIKKSLITFEFKSDIKIMEDKIFYIELFSKITDFTLYTKNLYYYFQNTNSACNNLELIYRNDLQFLNVNEYLLDILKKNKLGKKYLIIAISANYSVVINNFFLMCFNNFKVKDIKKNFIEIRKTRYFKKNLHLVSSKNMPVRSYISFVLLKYNLFYLFIFSLYIRKLVKIIINNKHKEQ